MMIYKCDSCKNELTDEKRKDGVRINRFGMMQEILLCGMCAKGVFQLLEKKKLRITE